MEVADYKKALAPIALGILGMIMLSIVAGTSSPGNVSIFFNSLVEDSWHIKPPANGLLSRISFVSSKDKPIKSLESFNFKLQNQLINDRLVKLAKQYH